MTESQKNYHSPAALVTTKNKKITDWSCAYIPLCHQYIHSLIETLQSNEKKKDIRVLDIGCGNGQFTRYLYNVYNGTNVTFTGCDISEKHINLANAIHDGPNYVLVPKAVDGKLPFEDDAFDIIICNFVISCMSNNDELQLYIKQIKRVLNGTNGVLLLVVNNPTEIVDTRFSGIQICAANDDIKPMDNVTLKFYQTITAKEPYYVTAEVWRSRDMIQNILNAIFSGNEWNIRCEGMNHKSKFDFYVEQLNMDPTLLILERERYPFTVFIVESNNVYTNTQNRNSLLVDGYVRINSSNVAIDRAQTLKIKRLIRDFMGVTFYWKFPIQTV